MSHFYVNPSSLSPLYVRVCVLCHHHYFFIFAESSTSHPSVSTHSLSPTSLCEDNDGFSDFQGPLDAPPSFPAPSSTPTSSPLGFSTESHVRPPSNAPKAVFSEDSDDFCDFVQGPTNVPSPNLSSQANQVQPSSPSQRTVLSSSSSSLSQSLSTSVSIPTVTQHSAVNTSSKTAFQGNSFPF